VCNRRRERRLVTVAGPVDVGPAIAFLGSRINTGST
jgi:hypothetical protein